MPAYAIANIEVTDPERFAEYGRQVQAVVAQYGGRYLVRGGAVLPVEGAWPLQRMVILEFDSIEAARRWHDSPEYAPLLEMRLACTRSEMVFVEGYVPPG